MTDSVSPELEAFCSLGGQTVGRLRLTACSPEAAGACSPAWGAAGNPPQEGAGNPPVAGGSL